MKPVNSKSLFHTICEEIEQVKTNEKPSIARAQSLSSLAKVALGFLTHEVVRAKYLAESSVSDKFRNIELKDFDSQPE